MNIRYIVQISNKTFVNLNASFFCFPRFMHERRDSLKVVHRGYSCIKDERRNV